MLVFQSNTDLLRTTMVNNLCSQFLISIFLFSFLHPISSSNLRTLPKQPNFDPQIALIGDAALVDGDAHSHGGASFVKLTRPVASSFGLLLHNKPFNLHGSTSFFTQFTFSVSPGNAGGLVLSLFPAGVFPGDVSPEKRLLSIHFVSGNLSGGYLKTKGINIVVPNNWGKLISWVDYDFGSKMVEIRLSKFGDSRPYDPLFEYPIDLLSKCEGREVFVGLSSWNRMSSEWSRVFSWRFGVRTVPKWLHSLPVDPKRLPVDPRRRYEKQDGGLQKNRRLWPLATFAGLIFATGCGALMAFLVLFVWAIAGGRDAIFEAEVRSGDLKYEKVSVVVEDGLKDGGAKG